MTTSRDRTYDVVIFGASGFTGAYVVEEMARIVTEMKQASKSPIKWAVAGRSSSKLQSTLKFVQEVLDDKEVIRTDIILCDVNDPSSLRIMAAQTRVVLNCVGPYRFFGEQVVRACIEAGTHHLDISGEPQYLESMQLNYDQAAREKGVYVIGSCGFDSIPAELGFLFTQQEFKKAFPDGELNAIESYFSTKKGPDGGRGHYATYQSAIHGFGHVRELKDLRRKLFAGQKLPPPQYTHSATRSFSWSDLVKGYLIPFPGSDKSVVMRSQRLYYQLHKQKPVQFFPFMRIPSFLGMAVLLMFGTVFSVLAQFSWGRRLLERYPGIFSGGMFTHEGPTRKQVLGCSFTMTFKGFGWEKAAEKHNTAPDRRIITTLKGPEIGYILTSKCLIWSGLTILLESDKMPSTGGVFPPGAAFRETQLIKRLQDAGMSFTSSS